MSNQVIIVGGGLSGLSAAHTVLERGGTVLLLDKNPFLGGNSTKATSGINGSETRTQKQQGIPDTNEAFYADTGLSATKGKSNEIYPLGKVLVDESAPAVHWLQDAFNLDLSLVSRLGGHSFPRTHRGKEKFPGFTITYALMEKLEDICKKSPSSAKVILRARVVKLITDSNNAVVGVEYEQKGKTFSASGPVILATGGYGADFASDSLLIKYRPDLANFPTTNGEHCTGDGIKLAVGIGADLKDMEYVQVHPTGLVHPNDPTAKVKFLAAEALRGVGGLLLNKGGDRFCNELGRRDYVSGEMANNQGPFRLVLHTAASKEIEWHCKHYLARGVMKYFKSGHELAQEMGIPASKLESTFTKYNSIAKSGKCPYGKKFFKNAPVSINDTFYVAQVTPIVHYCMGGVAVAPSGAVIDKSGNDIQGLFAAGEIMGGTHGLNRLGGSSLLDCVVYGRVCGDNVAKYMLSKSTGNSMASAANGKVTLSVTPGSQKMSVDIVWGDNTSTTSEAPANSSATATNAEDDQNTKSAAASVEKKNYSLQEIAKHNKETDCWVAINGKVLDVTSFMEDHPGGKKAIMLFAGQDASEEFNMLHDPNVIEKYMDPNTILGDLEGKASM